MINLEFYNLEVQKEKYIEVQEETAQHHNCRKNYYFGLTYEFFIIFIWVNSVYDSDVKDFVTSLLFSQKWYINIYWVLHYTC